jgi:hypothetical protein
MDTNPQLEYVKQQVDYEIAQYTQRKRFNRSRAVVFTVVPATLAALATVSIGTSQKVGKAWLPIVAMIATGIASILGAWESLFSNRKLWRVNNVALTGLYELKSDIEYREKATDRPITQQETDDYFSRLKTIRKEGELAYQRAVGND